MVNQGCIFCRIAAGEIKGDILHQDDEVIAIRDINPQAPTHILILPKAHITSLANVTPQQKVLLGNILLIANSLAHREGIATKGYRIVINTGPQAGQEVLHLHVHLLGGRAMEKMG